MRIFKRTYKDAKGRKKKARVYWFEFVHEGKRYQESTGLKNERQAEGYAAAYRLRLIEGEVGIKRKQPAPNFAQAMKDFLAHAQDAHAEHPATAVRYETASKPLLRFFGQTDLDAITTEDVEKYKARRQRQTSQRTGEKLKPATINRELACLKILFNHFIRLEVVGKNPVSGVKLLKEDNYQERVLSHEEEALYLATASQPLKDFAILMLDAGLRPDEVRKIKKGDVNLERNTLHIPKGKTKAARRKLALTARAAEVLRRRMEQAAGAYLFPHANDPEQPMIKPNHAHYGALKRSGIAHCRLYDLRHTFGSRLGMSGVDIVTLAALMGHSDLSMVRRYVHPTEGHQTNAIKTLDDYNAARQMSAFATVGEAAYVQ